MVEQASSFTTSLDAGADWGERIEVRCGSCDVGALLALVAQYVGEGITYFVPGMDPTGELLPASDIRPEAFPADSGLLAMPLTAGDWSLWPIRRYFRYAGSRPTATRVRRFSHTFVSAPVNIVTCRACGTDQMLNLTYLLSLPRVAGRVYT